MKLKSIFNFYAIKYFIKCVKGRKLFALMLIGASGTLLHGARVSRASESITNDGFFAAAPARPSPSITGPIDACYELNKQVACDTAYCVVQGHSLPLNDVIGNIGAPIANIVATSVDNEVNVVNTRDGIFYEVKCNVKYNVGVRCGPNKEGFCASQTAGSQFCEGAVAPFACPSVQHFEYNEQNKVVRISYRTDDDNQNGLQLKSSEICYAWAQETAFPTNINIPGWVCDANLAVNPSQPTVLACKYKTGTNRRPRISD